MKLTVILSLLLFILGLENAGAYHIATENNFKRCCFEYSSHTCTKESSASIFGTDLANNGESYFKCQCVVTGKNERNVQLVQTKEAKVLKEKLSEILPNPPEIKELFVPNHRILIGIGYTLGNMIMIEGTDGVIIIDATENPTVALGIYEEFRKKTTKPIKGIVITHYHADHIYGVQALVEYEKAKGGNVRVFMHSSTESQILKNREYAQLSTQRIIRQFGILLNPSSSNQLDSAIGSGLKLDLNASAVYPSPTDVFETEKSYQVAGVNFTLIHTPGETTDHISLWIPESGVIMPGDNVYNCFPNLYTIRGSPPRDPRIWYQSLDKIRRLQADYLIGSHGQPIVGKDEIFDVVTHYRDAIQFVYDQTFRRLSQGMYLDDVVNVVKLPPTLETYPYLVECYGKVTWAVRGIHSFHLGAFDGDPNHLYPLLKHEKAEKMKELLLSNFGDGIDGVERLLIKAYESFSRSSQNFEETGDILIDELQWGLELANYALLAAPDNSPLYNEAKNLTVLGLKLMGTSIVNSNARNYFISSAIELETGYVFQESDEVRVTNINNSPMPALMGQVQYLFKAENCDDTEVMDIVFVFPDLGQTYAYTMRHCVLEYNTDPTLIPEVAVGAKVSLNSIVWKAIVAGTRQLDEVIFSGDLVVEAGNLIYFLQFINLI